MFKFSLPTKVALLALFIAGTGVIGIAFYSFQDAATLLRQQSLQQLAGNLNRDALLFQEAIERMRTDLITLNQSGPVLGYIRAIEGKGFDDARNMTKDLWQQRLIIDFSSLLRQRQEYEQVRYIGLQDQGREIIRIERKQGHIQIVPDHQLQQEGHTQYFQKATRLTSQQQYITDVDINREHGHIEFPLHPVLRAVTPVHDQQGNIFGVIVINTKFDQLTQAFAHPPENVIYMIADANGDFVYHPDRDKCFSFALGGSPGLFKAFPTIDWKTVKPNQAPTFLFDLPAQTATLIAQPLQLDPLDSSRHLTLLALASHKVINQSSQGFGQRLLISILTVVVILSLAMALLAKRLLMPIKRLTAAADQITAGHEGTNIPAIKRTDEIGSLAHSLHTMLERLNQSRHALEHLTHSLEEQVDARTQALSIALKKAESSEHAKSDALQRAQQSDKAKSDFLATMSHEIRTPMNGILGMAELLLSTPLNEQQTKYASTICRSGEALLNIINDILDLSRIESGNLTIIKAPLDLRLLLEETLEAFAIEAQKKQLDLALQIRPLNISTQVIADQGRLRQVLVNLIGNAVKMTHQGSVTVQVDLQDFPDHQLEVQIAVIDTGVGISEALQAHIFKPFNQGDNSSTRQYGGTGLGLTIAQRLLGAMDSHIELESRLTHGSTFKFSLLLRKSYQAKDQASLTQYDKTIAADLSTIRVLVVDDNSVNRDILNDILTHWKMCPTLAESASQAEALLQTASQQAQPFQLILLDHMMPHISGIEFAQKLATRLPFAKIPIIILSSAADGNELRQLVSDNVREIHAKPYRQSVLFNTIAKTLLNRPALIGPPAMDGKIIPESLILPEAQILLVEDTEINADVVVDMLCHIGYSPDWAVDGYTALAYLQKKQYDIIFMDCHMPGIDGFVTTQKVRDLESSQAKRNPTPIIALTADAMRGDREACLKAGMDDYLSKPVRALDLKKMIVKWMPPTAAPLRQQSPIAKSKPTHDLPTLNPITLQKLSQEIDHLHQFLTKYLALLPTQMTQLKQLLSNHDTTHLARQVHSMKSAAATYGAERFAAQCQQLETLARNAQLDATSDLFTEMCQESQAVQQALTLANQQITPEEPSDETNGDHSHR